MKTLSAWETIAATLQGQVANDNGGDNGYPDRFHIDVYSFILLNLEEKIDRREGALSWAEQTLRPEARRPVPDRVGTIVIGRISIEMQLIWVTSIAAVAISFVGVSISFGSFLLSFVTFRDNRRQARKPALDSPPSETEIKVGMLTKRMESMEERERGRERERAEVGVGRGAGLGGSDAPIPNFSRPLHCGHYITVITIAFTAVTIWFILCK